MEKAQSLNKKDYKVVLGTVKDIEELENLYNELNDHLSEGVNYPGWIKGVYPSRETAVGGIKENNLFVLRINSKIAGSIILNHKPEEAYKEGLWGSEVDYKEIIVIHTFLVHPAYMKNSIGRYLMEFAEEYSRSIGMKTIRLDVSINNIPAIALYESCGYKHAGTVDLGLNIPGLVWFKLYELIL